MPIDFTGLSPYLSGEKFSNGLKVEIPDKYKDQNRVDLLEGICKDKRVIHVGCTDHIPLIKPKIENNTWLHKRIGEVAKECLGIDIDQESLEYVKGLGFSNVVYGNVTQEMLPEVASKNWDLMLLGEILEHVNNPVDFLSQIKKHYGTNVDSIVVSIPNVLNKSVFSAIQKGYELINSDHRYWFSPYTIQMVFAQAGIKVTDLQFSNRIPLSRIGLIRRKLNVGPMNYPFHYFQTIVITGTLK